MTAGRPLVRLEIRHPHEPARRPVCPVLELPDDVWGPDLPVLSNLRNAVEATTGFTPWVLGFWGASPVTCVVHPPETHLAGDWEPAPSRGSRAPWADPAWRVEIDAWLNERVGPHRVEQHRVWGRSTVLRVEVDGKVLWFKQSYDLVPGEGASLAQAHRVQGHRLALAEVVSAEGSRVLMRPLSGVPLLERPASDWAHTIRDIVQFQQVAELDPWRAMGVRGSQGTDWDARLATLFRDHDMPQSLAQAMAPRFEAPALLPTCLLPQDLGPCNLRWLGDGAQAFDWTDVRIGDPGMLLDRFLNECDTPARRDAVTQAWLDAWGPGAEAAWGATRRCALLHEAVRFDDELPWLDEDAPLALRLRALIRSQLVRLQEHVEKTSSPT